MARTKKRECDGGLNRRRADAIRAKARKVYAHEGSVEIDENAPISTGGVPGCYVQAWVWVYYSWVKNNKVKNNKDD